jgi:hypothetical protein
MSTANTINNEKNLRIYSSVVRCAGHCRRPENDKAVNGPETRFIDRRIIAQMDGGWQSLSTILQILKKDFWKMRTFWQQSRL